ncbi:glycosyl transferase family 1 [Pelomonas sp. Root662]|uniref:glycosyltransferase family 4 protein n=1 Tax=Pelomonas sp. Root405 TaxID=1736529 RepID=UPI0006F50108|nr:glycosyltransferase family 1 protein [Pelomonas sp. Root405]KQW43805.1 glycosyl transferase family 1 [Pelomonas sp. Root405]KRA71553.1 glycosyl transferase family 1 [Pelomonas sp. Root662]
MRIALISEHASPLASQGSVDAGGQNVYVLHVAQALARRGHHVDVLTRRDQRSLPTAVDMRPGVRVLHIDAGPAEFVPKEQLLPHMQAFGTETLRLMRASHPYDVVHGNFFMSGLVGLRVQRRLNVPLVQTFHALGAVRRLHQKEADKFPADRIELECRIAREADCVIAECPQDAADLMRHCGVPAHRIAQVPCGVDLDEFTPGDRLAARRRLGLPEDEFIVLQLGRLVPRKGIDNVIRAVGRLDNTSGGRPWRLLVVGGEAREPDEALTPEIGRLRAVAREAGVAGQVTFTGRRDRHELRDYYQAADVFVTTPWYEPFGITPLEAMACGTPVIGSAVGGIQHTVVDGLTGYLVPPNDPEVLAQRLEDLRWLPDLGRLMGRGGRARVGREFTWDGVAAKLARVYAQVAERRRSRVAATTLRLLPPKLRPQPSVVMPLRTLGAKV